MNIREMRTALDADNEQHRFKKLPDEMPDWAIRHLYEKRNGLPVTALPADVQRRAIKTKEELRTFLNRRTPSTVITDADRFARATKLIAEIEAEKDAAEAERLLLQARAILATFE